MGRRLGGNPVAWPSFTDRGVEGNPKGRAILGLAMVMGCGCFRWYRPATGQAGRWLDGVDGPALDDDSRPGSFMQVPGGHVGRMKSQDRRFGGSGLDFLQCWITNRLCGLPRGGFLDFARPVVLRQEGALVRIASAAAAAAHDPKPHSQGRRHRWR